MARLIELPRPPNAVLVSDDLTPATRCAASGGRDSAPRGDISVVGFDDIAIAQFTEPPLSTVRLPRSELAGPACNALLTLIGGQTKGRELRMSTEFVARESTGPPSSC